jgi:hypothetical protein
MEVLLLMRRKLRFFKEIISSSIELFQETLLWVALRVYFTTGVQKGFHLNGKCSQGHPKIPLKKKVFHPLGPHLLCLA